MEPFQGAFNLNELLYGSDKPVPRDDVSYGSEPMETSTPTGNGTGQFNWENLIGKTLETGLQYAIVRDQQKMGNFAPLGQPTTQQQVQVQGRQNNFLFFALCGLGVYLLVRQ